jgi:serine/threonine-protein kinase
MAEIFLAQRIEALTSQDKLLVIKRVLPELLAEPSFRDMFEREAAIAKRLHHPNIARVFGLENVGGRQCITMEHVVGVDLRMLVRLIRAESACDFPLDLALSVVAQVCRGLDYAHAQTDVAGRPIGIVHRDISPQNIMVGVDGVARIVDFGVAQCTHLAAQEVTRSGKLKGKLAYMSPEQARGEASDHRSDLFSAGVVLFELTTGRRLFKRASEFETLKRVCEARHPRPTEVKPNYPAELESLVMRALAPTAEGRFATGLEMCAAIEAFAAAEAIDISGESVARSMRRFAGAKVAKDRERIRACIASLATQAAEGSPLMLDGSCERDGAADLGDRRSHSTVRPIAATYHPPGVERAPFPIGVVAIALAIGAVIGALGARLVGS